MYVIRHAFLNLGKNKGRNILLGVIIFAIITATVVALAIFNTTGVVIEDTRMAAQSAVRIVPQAGTGENGQRIVRGGQGESSPTMEDFLSFSKSTYLHGSDISEGARGIGGIEAVFYLNHPDMLAAFEADLRERGLPDNYTVETDESLAQRLVGPVESLRSLALTFLIVVLVLGAVIMILLTAIAIRERKYEIGVLRAMGMKKKNVVLGLWIEILVITCLCFALGMGAGTALAQPVSDAIMVEQSEDIGTTTLADRLNEQRGADVGQSERIDISVNAITAFQIFGISILLASIAGIISVSRITKCEPIKILMERN